MKIVSSIEIYGVPFISCLTGPDSEGRFALTLSDERFSSSPKTKQIENAKDIISCIEAYAGVSLDAETMATLLFLIWPLRTGQVVAASREPLGNAKTANKSDSLKEVRVQTLTRLTNVNQNTKIAGEALPERKASGNLA